MDFFIVLLVNFELLFMLLAFEINGESPPKPVPSADPLFLSCISAPLAVSRRQREGRTRGCIYSMIFSLPIGRHQRHLLTTEQVIY